MVPENLYEPINPLIHAEIIMVRLQGDMAKPVDKRLNYKNCFDGLFRASLRSQTLP